MVINKGVLLNLRCFILRPLLTTIRPELTKQCLSIDNHRLQENQEFDELLKIYKYYRDHQENIIQERIFTILKIASYKSDAIVKFLYTCYEIWN